MGYIGTILSFIRALPALIRLVKEIWITLADFYEAYNRKKQAHKLSDALAEARKSGDTDAVEKFFNPSATKPADPGK